MQGKGRASIGTPLEYIFKHMFLNDFFESFFGCWPAFGDV
jgi:hypothetical protein